MLTTTSARELRRIAAALRSIETALARLAPALDARRESGASTPSAGASPARRKLKLSPARRAALKLQGQYMGYMRGLKAAQKKQVKARAAAKGIAEAVGLARRLARA
jgi:hypothetical protein